MKAIFIIVLISTMIAIVFLVYTMLLQQERHEKDIGDLKIRLATEPEKIFLDSVSLYAVDENGDRTGPDLLEGLTVESWTQWDGYYEVYKWGLLGLRPFMAVERYKGEKE